MQWFTDKNSPSHKQDGEAKFKSITEAYEALIGKTKSLSWYGFRFTSRENDKGGIPKAITPGVVANGDDPTTSTASNPQGTDVGLSRNHSRNTSRKDGNPIKFSYSIARRKPPPTEKTLECTLEDLCHGCVKKIMLTRDVLADTGLMVEERELLRIKVKPGWKKGTKITFEGIGDERPGMLPSDVIFSIIEEDHSLFKREGNDLIFTVGIPLVKALTGCTLSIPLLGGGKISCSIKEIIYPGYEKIIEGKGMPIANETGKRGDLRIKFQVDFPTQLSKDQRLDISSLLQDVS